MLTFIPSTIVGCSFTVILIAISSYFLFFVAFKVSMQEILEMLKFTRYTGTGICSLAVCFRLLNRASGPEIVDLLRV